MNTKELFDALEQRVGPGWLPALIGALNVHRASLHRWRTGRQPLPPAVAALIEFLLHVDPALWPDRFAPMRALMLGEPK